MGYRLVIYDKNKDIKFYGTKHYGYTCEFVYEGIERNFESIKYLVSIEKLEEDDCFLGGYFERDIELTSEELKHFLELYFKEINCECLLEDENIKELINNKDKVFISWG